MSFGHINFIQFSLLNIIFVCSCCLLAPVHDAPRKMTLEKKQLKFSEAQKNIKNPFDEGQYFLLSPFRWMSGERKTEEEKKI